MTQKLIKDMNREEKKAYYAEKKAAQEAWEKRIQDQNHKAWRASAEEWKRFVAVVSEKVKECEALLKRDCETPEFAAVAWASLDPEARRVVRLFALTLEPDDSMEKTVFARSGLTRPPFNRLIDTLIDLRVLLPNPRRQEPHLRDYQPDLHFVSGDHNKFSGGGCPYDVGVAQEIGTYWRGYLRDDPEPMLLRTIQAALYRAHGYVLNPAIRPLALSPDETGKEGIANPVTETLQSV